MCARRCRLTTLTFPTFCRNRYGMFMEDKRHEKKRGPDEIRYSRSVYKATLQNLQRRGSIINTVSMLSSAYVVLQIQLEHDFLTLSTCCMLMQMVREEGPSSLARGVGPNVFRAVLMNASQLASYDFFKAELLKTKYFDDNIYCHTTASFAAVRLELARLFVQK